MLAIAPRYATAEDANLGCNIGMAKAQVMRKRLPKDGVAEHVPSTMATRLHTMSGAEGSKLDATRHTCPKWKFDYTEVGKNN